MNKNSLKKNINIQFFAIAFIVSQILVACGGGSSIAPAPTLTPVPTPTPVPPVSALLSISRIGTGSGTIQSSPSGIACGEDCSENYPAGTVVALEAQAQSGSHFLGWGNTCTGISACVVTMNEARNVVATFSINTVSIPGAPTMASGVGGVEMATLSFTPPATGAAPDLYLASCAADGRVTKNSTGNSSPIVLSGLTGGVSYSCTVSAQNAAGIGAASNSQIVMIQSKGNASKVIGLSGMASWTALASAEQTKIKVVKSFFLHQSVGGDLEDGSNAIGFKFEYADSKSTSLASGLNGGVFFSNNGDPVGKINEFSTLALATKADLPVAIMKFGYADIVGGNLAEVKAAYLSAVNAIKAQGVRVLHVSPPLTYNTPEDNLIRIQMRDWMASTFPNDILFNLQDVESTNPNNGQRCERGGAWEICNEIRSTSTCPSLNQGIDNPIGGQGHLCYNPHAQNIAKAFLYSIYLVSQ